VGTPVNIPVLPGEIAELLDDALPSEDAATDEQVAKFLAAHTESRRPNLILGRANMLRDKYAAGESRHGSTTPVVMGGMAEARAGYYPAQLVIDTLKPIFLEAVAKPPIGKQGDARNGAVAKSEWDGIVAWGIAQANADDLDEIRTRIDQEMPEIPWPTEPPDDADHVGEWTGQPDNDGGQPKTPVLADKLLTRSALLELPDPQPLIGDVLDQGTVALLYGKWGTGKSFIAQDWGANVATGRAWQGRDTEQHRVLYIAAEGAYGLKGRLDAWESGWRQQINDGTFDVLPQPVNLTRPLEAANLAALIGWNGYGFVILDTLARCMVGADENSAKDCGLVVDLLHRLRQQTPDGRGVILGVHHAGKDGKTFRGSTTFEAGADTVYAVTLDEAVIILDRQKRKDGPLGDRHELKLEQIDGTGSCVVESSHLGSETTKRAETLLSHFVSHFADIGATRADLRDSVDLPRATFYRALNDLVKYGQLINEGTRKRPFYRAASK
jgi:hypothetical protein